MKRFVSIILAVIIAISGAPVGGLLGLKTELINWFSFDAAAAGVCKTQIIELTDFSENTHIEKIFDVNQKKVVYHNGGYDTYNALRTGKITCERNNLKGKLHGKLCYKFTATRKITEKQEELTTIVWVPVTAFQKVNAATNFDNVNSSLTSALNAGIAESNISCLYKTSDFSSKNDVITYNTFLSWLNFSYDYEGVKETFTCRKNGHVQFQYHTSFLVPANNSTDFFKKRVFLNSSYTEIGNGEFVEASGVKWKQKLPETASEYLFCLKRVSDANNSGEQHEEVIEKITPKFCFLIKPNNGREDYCINSYSLEGKGVRDATTKEYLETAVDLFYFATATKNVYDVLSSASNPVKIVSNILSFGLKLENLSKTNLMLKFKGIVDEKYEGALANKSGNGSVSLSNFSTGVFPCYAEATAPKKIGVSGDYFTASFALNRAATLDKSLSRAVAFKIVENEQTIITYAKQYASGNYKYITPLTDKVEHVTPKLKFSNVTATNIAQPDSTVKITLSGKVVNSERQNVKSYGFYLKAKSHEFTSKDVVGKNNNAKTTKEIPFSFNTSELKPDTLYYYRAFAITSNGTYYSETKSFRTPKVKPKNTKITSVTALDYKTNVETNSAELGIGDSVKVKWNKAEYADYYTIKINGIEDKTKLYGTEKVIKLDNVGETQFSVCAHNAVGSSAWTDEVKATVHDNVIVTFMNQVSENEFTEMEKREVVWNHSIDTLPISPSRVGGTFSGWIDSSENVFTSSTRVRKDENLKTRYVDNSYKVKFVDVDGNALPVTLNKGTANEKTVYSQTVYYGESAVAPEEKNIPIPSGYHFLGWDADFSHITTTLTVQAVLDSDNYDIPVYISGASAMRYPSRYVIDCTIRNRMLKDTNGRIIVALKNSEGRLITTTESYAYYIDANDSLLNEDNFKSETVRILVPVDENMEIEGLVADYAEIYLVKDFKTTVPVGEHFTVGIENCDPWSRWTETPTEGYLDASEDKRESKTQYRYRDLQITTASTYEEKTALTLDGWVWDQSSAKTGTPIVGSWTKTKPISLENRTINEKNIDDYTTKTEYRYKRYAYKNTSDGKTYYTYGSTWATNKGYKGSWQYTTSSTEKGKFKSYDGKQAYGVTGNFWFAADCNKNQGTKDSSGKDFTVYKASVKVKTGSHKEYQALDYPYTLTKCPDTFSEWSATKVLPLDGTREVETRELYRYYIGLSAPKDSNDTELVRMDYTSGNIGVEHAGKQAVLFIYKITEASDWTTEYIAQTIIDNDGNYMFEPYILREAPSAATGDYTVVLGVEGADKQIFLGKIEVPNSEYVYTVKFVDSINNVIISEQQVIRGSNAVIPEVPVHEGYTFSHWDMRSTDVQFSMTINAQYVENEYTVVYFDSQNTEVPITVDYVKHGESLIPPEAFDTEDLEFVGWDAVLENKTTVTSNIVVNALYKPREYTVTFGAIDSAVNETDFSMSVLETQSVAYNAIPKEPTIELDENVVFLGWATNLEQVDDPVSAEEIEIREDTFISPVYYYTETVEAPTASVKTGSYDGLQNIILSCETPGAIIRYTLDGSDPLENETAKSCPSGTSITISENCALSFVATHESMNSSADVTEYYVINKNNQPKSRILKLGSYDNETQYGIYVVEENEPYIKDEWLDIPNYKAPSVYLNYNIIESEDDTIVKYVDLVDPNTYTISKDQTLYLDYEPCVYTVKFQDYNGELIEEQNVAYGCSAVTPEDPMRDGYIFTGWDIDCSYLEGDIIVTAEYVAEGEQVSISLNRKNVFMKEGSQVVLKPVTKNSDSQYEWSSSNGAVATINEDGIVEALSAGNTEIMITLLESGETALCNVTVEATPEYSICLKLDSAYSLNYDYDWGNYMVVAPNTSVAELSKEFLNDNLIFNALNNEESIFHFITGNDFVGTGTRIDYEGVDGSTRFVNIVVPGDLDGNGEVTEKDGQLLKTFLIHGSGLLHREFEFGADYNQDFFVDELDYFEMTGTTLENTTPNDSADPSEICSCNCHKKGLAGYIFKILNLFFKIFKSNQYCACGVKHW